MVYGVAIGIRTKAQRAFLKRLMLQTHTFCARAWAHVPLGPWPDELRATIGGLLEK